METLCSFVVELAAEAMDRPRIEDIVYNCLDFCQVYGKTPHFRLLAEADGAALWQALELLRGESAGFSLLTEPERSRGEAACSASADIRIDCAGNAFFQDRGLGNVWEDRLADLWVEAGLEKEEIP